MENTTMADDSISLLKTLRKVSVGGDVDVLREGVRLLAAAIMEAEATGLTGVPKGERDPERPPPGMRLTVRNSTHRGRTFGIKGRAGQPTLPCRLDILR